MEELIKVLQSRPEIEKVWFNRFDSWCFEERPCSIRSLTRSEILEEPIVEPIVEQNKNLKTKKTN